MGLTQHIARVLSAVPIVRSVVRPKVVIILLVGAVTLCLGTLIYVQHANRLIVDRDMQTAVSLSEIAARFDHEDGNLYRLMVDEAANGRIPGLETKLGTIQHRIKQIKLSLSAQKARLTKSDQRRADSVTIELDQYGEALQVVSSMLEINFSTSVAMLRPFRSNADLVLSEIKGIAASGIADAHRHAEAAANRTRWLVGFVTGAVLIVAALSYAWLALAAERGLQLRAEIKRRSEAEQELLQLARTDGLTGLINRRVFGTEVADAIDQARANAGSLAVILIDLDGFKEVNDTHGHAAGDTVLTTVAQRLRDVVGAPGIIARLGGDEFAVLLPGSLEDRGLMTLTERTSRALHEPLVWRGNTVAIGASIGVAIYPTSGTEPSELLHAADIAMYEAKRDGKGGVCLFAPAMESERIERRRLEQELRAGIAKGEIQPFYQPIVRFADDTLCGFEVLARWQHPRLGLLLPDAFIGIAERTGQITDMTKSVLRQACLDGLQMEDHLRLAINISPVQLEEPGLAEALIGIIEDVGFSPARLEIEITEDAVMDDVVTAERVLQRFRTSGLSIALDDFGTGYSSLSNLRRLKFDKIKIDQSFVRTLSHSVESEKLVDAIIGLAVSFGMKVTGEGIEDEAAALLLQQKGCTQGQGYFFGKPACFADTMNLASHFRREAA